MTDHNDGTLVGEIQKRVNDQLARVEKPGLPKKNHGAQPRPTIIDIKPLRDTVIDAPIIPLFPVPPVPHELILPPGVSPFTVSVELPRTKLTTRELKVLAKVKPVPAEHTDVVRCFRTARRFAKAFYRQTLAAGGKADIDLSGKARNRRGLRCFVVKQWELGKVEQPARKRLTFAQAYPTISEGQQGPAQERASVGRKGKRHG